MKKLFSVLPALVFTLLLNGQTKPDIEWVSVPAGTFLMGSPENEAGRASGETRHQVTLDAFRMSRYEITFEQYDIFCQATKRKKPLDSGWGRGKQPVINVTREDAIAFASWLGCRLPTEAEWEYACRAGSTTPFNTGENLTTAQADYNGNYPYTENQKGENRQRPVAVGSFPPNNWGLYDMHGNVSEWVSDLWEVFTSESQVNPTGAKSGNIRIWRGGSWDRQASECRSAQRFMLGFIPNYGRNFIGFRIVSTGPMVSMSDNSVTVSKTTSKSESETGKNGITKTSSTTTSQSTTITFGKSKVIKEKEPSGPNPVTSNITTSDNSKDGSVSTAGQNNIGSPNANGTVSDIDGNIYHTITIGSQVWLAENLRTTRYRNGDPIEKISNNSRWSSTVNGAFCDYENDNTNFIKYSYLYNWYAVADSRNIAPAGWHIPSDEEWARLINFLGGERIAGGKLKESGIDHWATRTTGATNESGFTALPGGYRFNDGSFYYISYQAYWWSATPYSDSDAWFRNVFNDKISVTRDTFGKNLGFSVRCIKD